MLFLSILDKSEDPASARYLCQSALPALFVALIHNKLNDEVASDIFYVINNLITDPEQAIMVMGCDLALPVLMDCAECDNPKKRLAVVRIITKLAVMEPTFLQKTILKNQDRFIQFLRIALDPDDRVLTEFLNLIPILVVGNAELQQILAFNVMDSLIQHVRAKKMAAIAAL